MHKDASPSLFKAIGLFGIHENPRVKEQIKALFSLLSEKGFNVLIESQTAKANELTLPNEKLMALCEHVDIMITVGGDGNLLHAARALAKTGTPVIGINRGTLGFLTDIAPHQIETELMSILAGQYVESKRMLIQAKIIREGETRFVSNALNDIVLFPGEVSQLIEFKLYIDEQFVYRQRSDGLIVSTPTGSTAYALSAGGPILDPELEALTLVPKAPHSLSSRPIVIDSHAKVGLSVCRYRSSPPRLSFDGQNNIEVDEFDQIIISKQPESLRLLHPVGHDYFHALRTKLHWSHQPASYPRQDAPEC